MTNISNAIQKDCGVAWRECMSKSTYGQYEYGFCDNMGFDDIWGLNNKEWKSISWINTDCIYEDDVAIGSYSISFTWTSLIGDPEGLFFHIYQTGMDRSEWLSLSLADMYNKITYDFWYTTNDSTQYIELENYSTLYPIIEYQAERDEELGIGFYYYPCCSLWSNYMWSAYVSSFSVEYSVPPYLVSPANGWDYPTGTTVKLDWSDTRVDRLYYMVLYSTTQDFSSDVQRKDNLTQSEVEIGPFNSETRIYWKVQVYGNSTETTFVGPRYFDIFVPPTLDSITISGPTQVNENSGAQYSCTAYYSNGTANTAICSSNAIWSENCSAATINSSSGYLTTSSVTSDESCRITASYSGKTDTHDITIINGQSTRYDLSIDIYGEGRTSCTNAVGGLGGCSSPHCDISFYAGTVTTCTATPTAGWSFSGWGGGDCSGTGTCQVTMTSNKNVTATFINGGTDDCYEENDTMATAYYPGSNWEQNWLSTLGCTAVQADEDWYKIDVDPTGYERVVIDLQFTHADGDIDVCLFDSVGNPLACSISISDNEAIDYEVSGPGTYYIWVGYGNAGNTYDLWWDDLPPLTNQYRLTTSVSPSEGGSVSPDCSGGCPYNIGAQVTLTANANSGYEFNSWSGCDSPSGAVCTMTMTSDKFVTATFTSVAGPIGYMVTNDLWIRSVINTVEKGPVEAVWRLGGDAWTARGDRVIWGHFYASPSDVAWGSADNPDLFVKIWFDVSGRVDVNYFHVSVPDIEVVSDYPYDGVADVGGITTMDRRYIRHYYEGGNSYYEENYEDGVPASGYLQPGNPFGYNTINNLRIGSIINTVEKGPIEAMWRFGGQDTTARGDQVVWGLFYASPSDVAWGSSDNPDLYVKIWFDIGGWTNVNFFFVSVPDIEVYSAFPWGGTYNQTGTTILSDRYIRHDY